MSAHTFGGKVKRTKRYEMGWRVGNNLRDIGTYPDLRIENWLEAPHP
jgi:hypothetical protein